MKSLYIAIRVLKQIVHDKRYLVFSLIAPLIIIYFLKLFLDSLPVQVNESQYIAPLVAFVMHFIGFLLCAIVLVQERARGTLQRMFISGFRKTEIILGYVIGYMVLGTVQAIIVVFSVQYVFSLGYNATTLLLFFIVIWVLIFSSVMLGIFISTFARNEAEIIPFIPLIILPSIFLSGIVIKLDKLPQWAQWLGHIFPMYYANDVIQQAVVNKTTTNLLSIQNFYILAAFGLILLILASLTLRETD